MTGVSREISISTMSGRCAKLLGPFHCMDALKKAAATGLGVKETATSMFKIVQGDVDVDLINVAEVRGPLVLTIMERPLEPLKHWSLKWDKNIYAALEASAGHCWCPDNLEGFEGRERYHARLQHVYEIHKDAANPNKLLPMVVGVSLSCECFDGAAILSHILTDERLDINQLSNGRSVAARCYLGPCPYDPSCQAATTNKVAIAMLVRDPHFLALDLFPWHYPCSGWHYPFSGFGEECLTSNELLAVVLRNKESNSKEIQETVNFLTSWRGASILHLFSGYVSEECGYLFNHGLACPLLIKEILEHPAFRLVNAKTTGYFPFCEATALHVLCTTKRSCRDRGHFTKRAQRKAQVDSLKVFIEHAKRHPGIIDFDAETRDGKTAFDLASENKFPKKLLSVLRRLTRSERMTTVVQPTLPGTRVSKRPAAKVSRLKKSQIVRVMKSKKKS